MKKRKKRKKRRYRGDERKSLCVYFGDGSGNLFYPLTLIRKPIKNRFIRSFLYYVPYVTLSVMTFPGILSATSSVYSGAAGLLAALILAFFGASLFKVAVGACGIVFLLELFLV